MHLNETLLPELVLVLIIAINGKLLTFHASERVSIGGLLTSPLTKLNLDPYLASALSNNLSNVLHAGQPER